MTDFARLYGVSRLQLYHLPCTSTHCPKEACVYNVAGSCDEPCINKGNGDAQCHKMSNKAVINMLTNSNQRRK